MASSISRSCGSLCHHGQCKQSYGQTKISLIARHHARINSSLLNQITALPSPQCNVHATVSSTIQNRQPARRDTYNRTCDERERRVFLATFQRTSESSLSSPPLRLVLLRLRTADGGREKSAMAYRPTSDVANKIARERNQQL